MFSQLNPGLVNLFLGFAALGFVSGLVFRSEKIAMVFGLSWFVGILYCIPVCLMSESRNASAEWRLKLTVAQIMILFFVPTISYAVGESIRRVRQWHTT